MTTTPYLVHHLIDPREGDADRIALVDGERSVSYSAFSQLVARCAAALRANGLSRGDRVAIVLPKCIEECWAIFGTSQASGVFVPVNSVLRAQQIRHIVADSGARIVICSRALFETVSAALTGLDRLTILCAEEIADGSAATAADPARSDEAIGEDLAAILYTSGSTGKPKGVMLSHRNLLAGSRIVIKYLEITERDRILSILPFSFDYGLNQLLTAVQQRAMTVLFTFQLGDEIVRAIRDHAITGLAGVPTIWAILTKTSPLLRKTKLPTLRYITNSGGAVPSETVRRLREMLGDTRIFLMYGLTEAFRSTFLPPEEIDRRPTSIGKAIPECEVFAVKPDG
ncbi:MAG: AMP-binding protein, partial [Bradyrhizobium sp.]|uniref:AMP-binding protein n=1 Tax=Bradyrhizobium sp. TaxID=376 RepID=UPI00272F77BC